MRTCLLLIACLICRLAAGEVTVGDTVLKIPSDEHHRELGQESPFLQSIRAFIPPGIQVLYAEAPTSEAHKTNAGEATRISTCHLLMSLDELAEEDYTREDFIASRQDLVDGLKEGLEDTTMDQAMELMRTTLAQKTQSEFAIEQPTLVGEPEATDDHVRFTMLMAVTINERKVAQVIRGTMRPIRDKLVIIYSYQEIDGESAIERVTSAHAAFVDRLLRANSLVLPGDRPESGADDVPAEDPKAESPAPTTPKRVAEPAIIP